MKIQLRIDHLHEEDFILEDSSRTISSWLIDYYFTKIYSQELAISKKSIQPNYIIGQHDMFIIYQMIHSSSSSKEFRELCQNKMEENVKNSMVENYNHYLQRCGLVDIIDLFHRCQLKSSIRMLKFNIENVKNDIDRLFINYLVGISLEYSIDDEKIQTSTTETRRSILKLFDKEKIPSEPTISRNYIKHTLCTYLLLLLDTRNEHALVHCLATPARVGIERRTIVELRRLTKLSKNDGLTIYQILLSFVRRKELILSRISQESNTMDDQSFGILEKYYIGIKEFFDFIEQLQITIEENEHSKIQSNLTFRQLMTLIAKQIRKDTAFNRCDLIIKEIIEELCQCFQTTLPLMECTSPIRSASSGGTLAGRRFLRSVAYLCAKQIIDLPIILTNNDHYDSPSTGLRKATSSHLLKSPLTPIPIVIEQVILEEKVVEIPVESVFMWRMEETGNSSSNQKRFGKRKSQRCLDLSSIQETSFHFDEQISSQSDSSRQPLGEININSAIPTETNSHSLPFLLISEDDQENLSTSKKRTITCTNLEPTRKKQKKTNMKPLITGQKMITNFFQSKS